MRIKKYFWLVALLIALVCAQPTLAAPFSFVAMGDSRGECLAEPINTSVLSAMVAKVLELKPRPAFVLFPGDLVYGYGDRERGRPPGLAEQLRAWQEEVAPLARAGIGVYAVPGNHEIAGKWAAERQKVWAEVLGEPRHAFEHEGSHFIGLNTDRPRLRQRADEGWLERQLDSARSAGAEHIFVFGHEPAYPVSGLQFALRNRAGLWRLLERYGADAYICGHEHLYGRCWRYGVVQVITGGAGAPLHPPWAEGFDVTDGSHHFTLWRVDGPRVEVEVLAFKPGDDRQAKVQPLALEADPANPGTWREIDSFHYFKPPPEPALIPAAGTAEQPAAAP